MTIHWLQDHRQKNLAAFRLPMRKDERWKYTDLNVLSKATLDPKPCHPEKPTAMLDQKLCHPGKREAFVRDPLLITLLSLNGNFLPEFSNLTKLPSQIIICPFIEALQKHEALIKPHMLRDFDTNKHPFAALNAAHAVDGLFIYLPDQCETVLHLQSIISGTDEFTAHPHHIILLGKGSKLQLVEEHITLTDHAVTINKVAHLSLAENATLTYHKIQQESKQAVQIAHTFVEQQQNSSASFVNFAFGGAFNREELTVRLVGAGAQCHTCGFYHLRTDNHYVDNHVDIIHSAAHTKSEMLYKGILENKSRAVFNGRLLVEKNAQKILAYQANHNLLLSNNAEVYSKPELEIYADDVKCKHGASTGQIDENALFYLRSRGIEYKEAQKILLAGFADEILQRVAQPALRKLIKESMPC